MDSSFTQRDDPFSLFDDWLDDAKASEINDPNAMCLATVDADGLPDARMVLLKGNSDRGFRFFTNFESAKGRQIAANHKAALLFHWKSLRRQVRVRGTLDEVSAQAADEYFNSRHPQSRLGAWASQQSRPLESREVLVERLAEYEEKFGTENIPRPPYWSGYLVKPSSIEFWQDGEFRLHDRIVFRRETLEDDWTKTRLNP